MDRDRFDGTGQQVAGALEEAIGRLVGDRRLETEGAAEKTAGKARDSFGKPRNKLGAAPRD